MLTLAAFWLMGVGRVPVIQWFPGHMARARRQVQEQARLVDVVIEVVDARIPAACSNPDLPALVAGRPRVVALTKADLADPGLTRDWVGFLAAGGSVAVPVDAVRGTGTRQVVQAVQAAFQPTLAALADKGRRPRPARAMVVGMPNVGKSSLINRLAGQHRAHVGARPGVTRGQQWVRAGQAVELLDTPGILVPKMVDRRQGVLLAAFGSVKEEVISAADVAGAVLPDIAAHQPAAVAERWGVHELQPDPAANLAIVALAKGLLLPGGRPDLDRAASMMLRDLREGKLGRMTLERPPEAP